MSVTAPLGFVASSPMIAKRVTLVLLSSMFSATTCSSYCTAAWRLATAAAPNLSRASCAAVDVLVTSIRRACGMFRDSHSRHWDSACGLL